MTLLFSVFYEAGPASGAGGEQGSAADRYTHSWLPDVAMAPNALYGTKLDFDAGGDASTDDMGWDAFLAPNAACG